MQESHLLRFLCRSYVIRKGMEGLKESRDFKLIQ